MTDTGNGGPQVTFTLDKIESFGLRPQKDPRYGMSFYLWDHMFPRDGSGMLRPVYTVQETARLFFGKGSDWLRWRYREAPHYPHGYFVLRGIQLEPKRTEKDNRYYTLADIERMAYALVENNAIDGDHLSVILQIVLLEARLYHIIGEPLREN
jgi:integrase